MSYVYVKDKEGFVVKKLQKDLRPDEVIITQEEFQKLGGWKDIKIKRSECPYGGIDCAWCTEDCE